MKRALTAAVAILVAMVAVGLPAMAFAQEQPVDVLPGTVATNLNLKLQRDGRLSVTERITVPDGDQVHRRIPLRQTAGGAAERVFAVDGARLDGNGTVTANADEIALTVGPGVSTLTYTVLGAVADAGDAQDVRWQITGGWDVPVDRVEMASFLSPKVAQSIECLAGPVGSTSQCARFEIGHTQAVQATTFGLGPGERVDVALRIPVGTVPSNAVVDEGFDLAYAFSLTPASGAGLAGVGLLLVGGFGLLWYARGRDERTVAGDAGPVEVLMTDSTGAVTFASPDGVLPGQIGTVVDEHVDAVDVFATVLDLAVRNYLRIEEVDAPGHDEDWRIVRINPPDEALRGYERAVYELILGSSAETRISQLRADKTLDLTGVRDALYADVVDKNWFGRRPDSERNLFWWIGVGIALGGVALTVVLASTGSLGLLGIGVMLGGIASTFGARLMPARTARGGAVVAQVHGLREYLRGVSAQAIPVADREMVFSRSLPYAVVLGATDRWLAEFAELDPGADGTPGLYWYGELSPIGHAVPDLRRFLERFPRLLTAMNDVLIRAGGVRASEIARSAATA